MSTGTNVGMIGTGTMGSAMAKTLLEAGHTVVVHDLRRAAAAPLLDAGARWAETPRELAEPMPVTSAAHQHYLRGIAAGLDGKLCLATLAVIEEVAGVRVPARKIG